MSGTSCNWIKTEKDTVFLINSIEELSKYISCQLDTLPIIDFDKLSLLLVCGVNTSGIHSITHDLQQISTTECKFMIDITIDMTGMFQVWSAVLLTPKIPKNSVVKLDLRQH